MHVNRSRSPPPNGKGISWENVFYDVKKKVKTVSEGEPALGMSAEGSWEKCEILKKHTDGTGFTVRWSGKQGLQEDIGAEEVKPAGLKRILKGVSGNINSGRLCAIMGPSGAGKSSLLNILAGRVANGSGKKVSGDIRLNGAPLDPVAFRNKVAYVMQEDALFATQTPFEALHFSARLRTPERNAKEREHAVQEVLRKLRLVKCAHTLTGSAMIPGLSGGEKKRTAIGIELISNPEFLFLDEPTSGLDSYAAWMVCDMLRRLANGEYDGKERTVVATIHQPSSECFALFDDVILVSNGRSVYNGPREALETHFSAAGHPIAKNTNLADHVMFAMQLENEGVDAGADEESNDPTVMINGKPRPLLADYWKDTEEIRMVNTPSPINNTRESITDTTLAFKEAQASFITQFICLGMRDARNVIRDKGSLIARFGSTIFINLIVGFVFQSVGSTDPDHWTTEAGIQNHFGGLSQIAIGGMFGLAQPLMLSFPLEKPVFIREYATGTYGSVPYFTSKLLVEVPMTIVQSVVLFFTTFWIMELNGNFVYLVLATSLLGLVAASTALLIGAISSNPQIAIQLSPLLFVPQILFSGFFIPTSQIPSFMSWAQYLCSLKYGVNLLTIAEFRSPPGSLNETQMDMANELIRYADQSLFLRNDIHTDKEWEYVAIMVGVFCLFRGMACTVLAWKGRTLTA
eukprot:TRINITY_DN4874_c0_g2_i1.p1 TRINITY_DN4874_c0_g2~~TRINITY_DN4874_c0_g2_i1.p1  ORF type:complete len:707 (+),score=93.12 TRINITY_DN4874_c0_g2_i1:55-2121(+)